VWSASTSGHLKLHLAILLVLLLLLQACAALDFRPPGWLMVPLVSALQQQLGLLTPADLAGEGDRQQCTSSGAE
jgi:hypothetical protein